MREPAPDAEAGDPQTPLVLVVETVGSPYPAHKRRRKAKPREVEPGESAPEVPVTRLMVIVASELEGEGEAWLEGLKRSQDELEAFIERGLDCIRRAIAARRVTASDPSIGDPSLDSVLAVRVGFGEGDHLVERQWERAYEIPQDTRRSSRRELLRPQERLSALLGLRTAPLACEELLVRARADADAGRSRELALQMRVALEALLAEREVFTAAGQAEDLAFLDTRRQAAGEAANEALRGPLSADRVAEVAETLNVCERVLRRRAAHG